MIKLLRIDNYKDLIWIVCIVFYTFFVTNKLKMSCYLYLWVRSEISACAKSFMIFLVNVYWEQAMFCAWNQCFSTIISTRIYLGRWSTVECFQNVRNGSSMALAFLRPRESIQTMSIWMILELGWFSNWRCHNHVFDDKEC